MASARGFSTVTDVSAYRLNKSSFWGRFLFAGLEVLFKYVTSVFAYCESCKQLMRAVLIFDCSAELEAKQDALVTFP